MEILQIIPYFVPAWGYGGPIAVCYEMSKKLAENGHSVTVCTTDAFDSKNRIQLKEEKIDGIDIIRYRNISNYFAWHYNMFTPRKFKNFIKKNLKNYDLVHLHDYRTFLNIVLNHYACKYDVPYILQAHGSVLPFFAKQRLKNLYDLMWGYRILKGASKAIALNTFQLEQYKKMGVDEEKIEIVPNGIDLSEYRNLPRKGEFRSKYSIRENEKIILFLGRIHKIKGIDLLVQTFAELSKEMDNIRLVIVGPDEGFLSTLKRQIEDLKIRDKILFTGPLYDREKFRAYVDADVFVLPSLYETFPTTVLEACACSTPIIVTNCCNISDIVDKFGYVIEYERGQLHDAIFKVLNDKNLSKTSGERGRNLVREEFNWDKIVKKIEKIYEDCTSNTWH